MKILYITLFSLFSCLSHFSKAAETRIGSQGGKQFIHLEDYDEESKTTVKDTFIRKSSIIFIEVKPEYSDPEEHKKHGLKYRILILTSAVYPKAISYSNHVVGGSSNRGYYINHLSKEEAMEKAKKMITSQ